VGWIGRNRLEALARSELVEVVAVADPSAENLAAARQTAPMAIEISPEQLLELDLDGLVIATPSAMHAKQAVTALERGMAVFCQKPLGRTAAETARVVDAARSADRLLGIDLSYRFLEGTRRVRELVLAGELGSIYAVDLVFHNAYGPDKAWFYDPALSGGGCVIDLGIHLVDLALWTLQATEVSEVSSRLFARGAPLEVSSNTVEDFALAEFTLDRRTAVRLACSWNLPAGCDAVIQASFFGTLGGALLSNVNGSFYDFTAERFRGTSRERLCSPPDNWGGRAIVAWARQLGQGSTYDPSAERLVEVASVLDAIYGRTSNLPERVTAHQAVLDLAAAGAA
jgi:predicted dehydrogenase